MSYRPSWSGWFTQCGQRAGKLLVEKIHSTLGRSRFANTGHFYDSRPCLPLVARAPSQAMHRSSSTCHGAFAGVRAGAGPGAGAGAEAGSPSLASACEHTVSSALSRSCALALIRWRSPVLVVGTDGRLVEPPTPPEAPKHLPVRAAHRLPLECLDRITGFMDARALCTVACVNKAWKSFADRPEIWEALCLSRWGVARCSLAESPLTAKQLYRMLQLGWLSMAADATGRGGETTRSQGLPAMHATGSARAVPVSSA